VPPPEVTFLVDQLRAELDAGRFARHGRIDLGPEGSLEAELAARIVLADIDHWSFMERTRRQRVSRAQWGHLSEQLQRLLWYANAE
jgi:hypothetical protein